MKKMMKKIDPKRTDLTAEERRLLMLQGLEDAKTKGIGKKAGGMMKAKGMAKGKMVKKMMAGGKAKKMMSAGGKLKMVEGKDGKQVPFYAADGVGKMKAGGMMKKGYAKGKMVKKMMAGGKTKGAAKGGKSKVRGSGIARKGVRPVKMR